MGKTKNITQKVTVSQRLSGIVKSSHDFITHRYGEIFDGKTIDEVIEILESFQDGLSTADKKLLTEGGEAFQTFLKERDNITRETLTDYGYGAYRNSVIKLAEYSEKLMNNFRGYFDSYNTKSQTGDYSSNKLIYLIASNTEKKQQINVAFTDFTTMLNRELDLGARLYANSNTLIDLLKSDKFTTGKRLYADEELMKDIGVGKINNISYFLNTIINESYAGDMSKVSSTINNDIITQIKSVISKGDPYNGKTKNGLPTTQYVTSARMVDILLGDDRLEKVASGQWKDVADSLSEYASRFKAKDGTLLSKLNYLSKMMGENVPGALLGDAIKFSGEKINGKTLMYDVLIKTLLDGNRGLGMISTNALAADWIMFTNPALLAAVITDNLDTNIDKLSKADRDAMNLWAEDLITESTDSNVDNQDDPARGVYDFLADELGIEESEE